MRSTKSPFSSWIETCIETNETLEMNGSSININDVLTQTCFQPTTFQLVTNKVYIPFLVMIPVSLSGEFLNMRYNSDIIVFVWELFSSSKHARRSRECENICKVGKKYWYLSFPNPKPSWTTQRNFQGLVQWRLLFAKPYADVFWLDVLGLIGTRSLNWYTAVFKRDSHSCTFLCKLLVKFI